VSTSGTLRTPRRWRDCRPLGPPGRTSFSWDPFRRVSWQSTGW